MKTFIVRVYYKRSFTCAVQAENETAALELARGKEPTEEEKDEIRSSLEGLGNSYEIVEEEEEAI
jgi:hypothetical protein